MINGINHITISVRDINTSFDFYKNVLLFKPVMKSEFSAYFKFKNLWIALQQEKREIQKNNLYSHIAFNISKRYYDKMVEHLKINKVKTWQKNKTEGESFYFIDPDGNKFEIHYSTLKDRIKHGKKNWSNKVKWFV